MQNEVEILKARLDAARRQYERMASQIKRVAGEFGSEQYEIEGDELEIVHTVEIGPRLFDAATTKERSFAGDDPAEYEAPRECPF